MNPMEHKSSGKAMLTTFACRAMIKRNLEPDFPLAVRTTSNRRRV